MSNSRLFIGAVSRIACEPVVVMPPSSAASRMKLLALLPGDSADDAALHRYADWARGLPGLAGLVLYRVRRQGPAPNSSIPHLPVSAAGVAELAFPSLVDLECAVGVDRTDAAHFVVEEHRLV